MCDDETWRAFLEWGARHNVKGYRNRVTVQATIKALLDWAIIHNHCDQVAESVHLIPEKVAKP